jgi:hypothetical protein
MAQILLDAKASRRGALWASDSKNSIAEYSDRRLRSHLPARQGAREAARPAQCLAPEAMAGGGHAAERRSADRRAWPWAWRSALAPGLRLRSTRLALCAGVGRYDGGQQWLAPSARGHRPCSLRSCRTWCDTSTP